MYVCASACMCVRILDYNANINEKLKMNIVHMFLPNDIRHIVWKKTTVGARIDRKEANSNYTYSACYIACWKFMFYMNDGLLICYK